ncbi:MAG: WxcM-like domain-containing protein [Desulfomonile tiedjei]|nr:WxcM-like domain-containing protein [Desulfomonile tiedjei]
MSMGASGIRVESLPLRTQGRVPRRICEDRGELAVLHPVGPVYNPVYFDLHPGEDRSRGGHYHKSKTEFCYVISGSCSVEYLDLNTGEQGFVEAHHGDRITIGPRCAHRMQAVKFCQCLEFSADDVDYAEDTVSYVF